MQNLSLRVLILGAQPSDGPPLRLEEELRRIQRIKQISVVPISHTRFSDVTEQIARVRPHIIQVSAHGTRSGKLVFEDEDGQHEFIPQAALQLIFSREAVSRHVRGVLLNACYSLELAKDLCKHVDFAVGTPDAIRTQAAAQYPAAFYAALARDEHVQDACRAAEAEFSRIQPDNRPQLCCAKGLDPQGYRMRLQPPDSPEPPLLYIHHEPSSQSDSRMLDELSTHLRSQESSLKYWDRSQLAGGQTRTAAVTQHLERADLILCLLSPKAQATEEWATITERILQRRQAQDVRVFLVTTAACSFESKSFGGLGLLNDNMGPLDSLSKARRGGFWVSVVNRLKLEAAAAHASRVADLTSQIELNKQLKEESERQLEQRNRQMSSETSGQNATPTNPPVTSSLMPVVSSPIAVSPAPMSSPHNAAASRKEPDALPAATPEPSVAASSAVTAFISYSQDSSEHIDRVVQLATRLRNDGIDVELDQWVDSPPEGWPQWMERQTRKAQFVLVVCTETYNLRSRGEEQAGRGRGVRWESLLTHQHIYDADSQNRRFIPVLFRRGDGLHIPTPLSGATHYNVGEEAGYQDLYRRLTNQPIRVKPPLGGIKPMPPVATSPAPSGSASAPNAGPNGISVAAPIPTSAGYTRPSLREFIMNVLVSDSDLEAFYLDYYPDIKRFISSGMDRVAKVNALLEREDAEQILQMLQVSSPARYARHRSLLRKVN